MTINKTSTTLLCMWSAAVVAAIVLPFPIFALLFIPSTVFSFRRWRQNRGVVMVGFSLGCIRCASMFILIAELNSLPLGYASPRELALSFPPFSLLIYPDVGQFEAKVAYRRNQVGKGDFSTMDPFTAKPYMTREDGVVYSVGPDLADQGARFTYDPTNGTFSPGDILVLPRR